MSLAALPHLLVLTILLGSALPLMRRVGPHANTWFLGWVLIVTHYAALLFDTGGGLQRSLAGLVAIWALELGGLCFLRAAGNSPVTRTSIFLTIEMALPLLVRSLLLAFDRFHYGWRVGTCMLLLAPGIHMVLWPEHRNRARIRFAAVYVGLLPFVLIYNNVDMLRRTGVILALLFVGAGILYWVRAQRHSRAVFMAAFGLVLWGLTYLAQPMLRQFAPEIQIDPLLWLLPQYVVIAGMMLSLLEEHLTYTERLAMHDALTGLANRRLLDTRLEAALKRKERDQADWRRAHSVGCIVIDIDNFKTINDTLGHSVGDHLLQALAVRLKWNLDEGDLLCRTGGDEFTALLPYVPGRDRLQFVAGALMSAAAFPISLAGHDVEITLSIGVAMYPRDAGDAMTLCHAADQAMYRAKRAGGSMIAFAGEELEMPSFMAQMSAMEQAY